MSLTSKKLKIAFVVQRYGLEVNGGSESHCRQVAEHLSSYHDVEVITTCAIDYMTWKNEYPSGKDKLNGVTLWRFPVDYPRDVEVFNKLSEKLFGNQHDKDEELRWMELQGPYSTALFNFIRHNSNKYDYFIFFTYLYCTTFIGLPLVKYKAILVPTAHDEPPIYLEIFRDIFTSPKAIMYNTIEEKQFIENKFNNFSVFNDVVGVGIELQEKIQICNVRDKYEIYDEFITFIGRIDESKGCGELFKYFIHYKNEFKSNIKLVLIGKAMMEIPEHEDIISIGFISEEDKIGFIEESELTIMPSKYESFSMVVMESWAHKKAVLVNGSCKVLKGHCIRSNAGLWYENYEEFKECLNLLISEARIRNSMGENGKKYVEENYSWNKIEEKYIQIFNRLNKLNIGLTSKLRYTRDTSQKKQEPRLQNLRPNNYILSKTINNIDEVNVFDVRYASDFDWLESAIIRYGFYEYPHVWGFEIDDDKRLMAEIIASFSPERVLEIGCSNGSVLQCLHERGISCEGVEISQFTIDQAFPAIKDCIHKGDLLELKLNDRYDLIFGLDIFEHLNPNKLWQYLSKVHDLLIPGGFVYANIPAIGVDPVFGELFPSYVEAWQKDIDSGKNFSKIPVDQNGYPIHGHLIWGDSAWWVNQFKAAGFERCTQIEKSLHDRYDFRMEHTFARKAYYVFTTSISYG